MNTGSLVYVLWPHGDTDEGKNRPALILNGPDWQGDVTLLKVTGKPHYQNTVRLDGADLVKGELFKSSYIRLDRFLTAHISKLQDRGKTISPSKMAEVHKKLAVSNSVAFSSLAHIANGGRSFREGTRRSSWSKIFPARQLGILGKLDRARHPDHAQAPRSQTHPTRRRGHYCGRRLSDHRGSHPSARCRSRLHR